MLTINLKSRFRNKAFLMALVSAIILLLKNFGLDQYIPENMDSIVNGSIAIGILLGVVVDPSTPGISDKVIQETTAQAINKVAETKEEVKTEDSTTAINNTVSENSQGIVITNKGLETTGILKINDSSTNASVQVNLNASSKINVDNPDNVQAIDNEVNATSAVAPH